MQTVNDTLHTIDDTNAAGKNASYAANQIERDDRLLAGKRCHEQLTAISNNYDHRLRYKFGSFLWSACISLMWVSLVKHKWLKTPAYKGVYF